jgi:hypothetical protein
MVSGQTMQHLLPIVDLEGILTSAWLGLAFLSRLSVGTQYNGNTTNIEQSAIRLACDDGGVLLACF